MSNNKISLSEESEEFKSVKEEWREEAKATTLDTLTKFVSHLCDDYDHDYGTIIHAMKAAATAAVSAVDHSPYGGITGFQASALSWELLREFRMLSDGPLKLIAYENMLFPQYEIGRASWRERV